MQIIGMIVFLVIWLLILWSGSIALETTGMERAKARFQALSAISGTGFTTREAESVVDHPRRRRIVSWLIFLGNAGIMSFLILLVLYVRSGVKAPTLFHISTIVVLIVVLGLFIVLGLLDKLSNALVGLMRRGKLATGLPTVEILHQAGDYGIARFVVSGKAGTAGFTLRDSCFFDHGFAILAIERSDRVLPFPKGEEIFLSGDHLLCYGRIADMTALVK